MAKLSAIAAAVMVALAIAACGSEDRNGSSGHATKVAYSNPVGAQPGQQDIVFGFKGGANELRGSERHRLSFRSQGLHW